MVFDPFNLRESDRSLQVCHAEIVPNFSVQKTLLPAESKIAEAPCTVRKLRIIRDNHPALAGRDDLISVEAKASHCSDPARAATIALGTMRFGRVLDDRQIEFARQLHQRRHI